MFVVDVMVSEVICKVGFGLDYDCSVLFVCLGVVLNNVIDLDCVFKCYGYVSLVGVCVVVVLVLG